MHNTCKYKNIDEMYIDQYKDVKKDVNIFDARDKIAVYGNMLFGRGSENT